MASKKAKKPGPAKDNLNFSSTADIKVPTPLIDTIIGQESAVRIVKKVARQRRHLLLIGQPGVGKSLIGQALAELLPKEKLLDILSYDNPQDENVPIIKTTKKGLGQRIVQKARIHSMSSLKNQNILFFILVILAMVTPWYIRKSYGDILAAASLIASMMFLGIFIIFISLNKRMKVGADRSAPKLLIDNASTEKAPFIEATGAHSGALLGDCLHDPLQSFSGTEKITKSNGKTIAMAKEIDKLLKKHEKSLIKKEGYEAAYLKKGEHYILTEKQGKIQPVEILSVNRYKSNKPHLIKITTLSGKTLVVTPEHKVAVKRRGRVIYKEAQKLTRLDKIITKANRKMELIQEKLKKIEKIPYKGCLYNLTTASGNLLANNILVKNSGGLGTPPYERLIPGFIHRASGGVLFLDEVANLSRKSQQELLTAIQEKKYPITGQSERSSGAMTRSQPVPCDFILVAAGNPETIMHMHPALRSRIRGYGYEVFMDADMPDNPENQFKLAQFIAQEVKKDAKIPHFSKEAVLIIIEEARKRAGKSGKLTLRLRELGGLVRAAGDIALEQKSEFVQPNHIREAKKLALTLEQQIADRYIEQKKDYQVILSKGTAIGKVNGLAVMGSDSYYSGIVLPIESEITPGGKKATFIATGQLGKIAKEAVKNVSAIILKHFHEDLKAKYDVFVQFIQTADSGVEGDSASIAVATAIVSALKQIPIRQDTALTGSLSVRGEVLAIGGVTAKIEAAIEAGIARCVIPEANLKDVFLSQEDKTKIKIIPVKTIQQVLIEMLDWSKNKPLLKQLKQKV